MRKNLLLFLLVSLLAIYGKAQSTVPEFDTTQFRQHLTFANYLLEYEAINKLALNKYGRQPEYAGLQWFSFKVNNSWHIIGGNKNNEDFNIIKHILADSLSREADYTGSSDTMAIQSYGSALALADGQFQFIRDTSSLYFTSFLVPNPDQTISVWYLPDFQPSGQAIYGCEWEYVFNKSGKDFLRLNHTSGNITGVWIGQPRELWLNYRNLDKPTAGSLFFALSFHDYFTRLRIDTRLSTSTTAKDKDGRYTWTHKMK